MTRTVVITGTATGIGKLSVERFAAEGWNVLATVRKESASTPWSTTPATTRPARWKPRRWTKSTASSRPTSSA
jgi:NAD(P)-dependent dehydrogenase (short-subunit alcohol dehydrogenase family)